MRRIEVPPALATHGPEATAAPLVLRDMGSFHIGGRHIDVTGKPPREVMFTTGGVPSMVDPNGRYQIAQMYVQYFLPQHPKGTLPLLLWHGGNMTGVTYETKPDGKPGWLNYFIRAGWDTYVSDAVERGRSGWTPTFFGDPLILPYNDPWERFRMGPSGSWHDDPAKRATYPGMQFPVEFYAQFMKQSVPRWLTTDRDIVDAYVELVDAVGPCVVMVHSQSGAFGYKVLEARPDKIKALIAIEPTYAGDKTKIAMVKDTPILVVIGDNAKTHPRWKGVRQISVDYCDEFKAAGGDIVLLDLPDAGIAGNSHMVMMDRNSDEVAALIQDWLVSKGLAAPA